jgi:exopolysaccharide biosynthesis polyprenyl glycosylphosphotransferase
MLTEQKRYLFPAYLLLNSCCAVLFCLIHLLGALFSSREFVLTLLSVWLMGYLLPVLILLWIASYRLWFGKNGRGRKVWPIYATVGILIIGSAIVIAASIFGDSTGGILLFRLPDIIERSLLHITLGYVFSLGLMLVFKWCLIFLVKRSGPESSLIKSVLIVGTGERSQIAAEEIDKHPQWGMRVSGFLTNSGEGIGGRVAGYDILESVENIGAILKTCITDMVIVARDGSDVTHVDTIMLRCRLEGVDVAFLTDPNLPPIHLAAIEHMEALTLWIVKFVLQPPGILFFKRLFDFSAAAVLCFLCLPVWIVLPLLIRLDSPGPILFRQERVGKNGRRFTMYKFRSMVADAERRLQELIHLNEMDGPTFKMKADPRVTRMGGFLRKTSLDELPQLFNVLKGDISLVGPRPPLYEEVCQYRPWEKRRLSVMQGITGFWQVSGRNEIKFDEWMKLDLMYIDQWRFMLDIVILLRTVPAVMAIKGAR